MGNVLGFAAAIAASLVAVWCEWRRRTDVARASNIQVRLDQQKRQQTRSEAAASEIASSFGSILALGRVDVKALREIAVLSVQVGDEVAAARIHNAVRLLRSAELAAGRFQCPAIDIIDLAARHGLNAAAHVATGRRLEGDAAGVRAVLDVIEMPAPNTTEQSDLETAERVVRATSWVSRSMAGNISEVLSNAVINGKIRAKPDCGARYCAIEVLHAVGALKARSGWHSWMDYVVTPMGTELHGRLVMSGSARPSPVPNGDDV